MPQQYQRQLFVVGLFLMLLLISAVFSSQAADEPWFSKSSPTPYGTPVPTEGLWKVIKRAKQSTPAPMSARQSGSVPLSIVDSGVLVVGEAIPDNDANGIQTNVAVDTALVVESLDLVLVINHPNPADLQIAVSAPSGQQAVTAFGQPIAREDGLFEVSLSMTDLAGNRAQGVWQITVVDQQTTGEGILESWQLILQGRAGQFETYLPVMLRNAGDGCTTCNPLIPPSTQTPTPTITTTPEPNATSTLTPTPTPTETPFVKPTFTPTPTQTPEPIYLPNGNFEQGDEAFWQSCSCQNQSNIFDRTDPQNPTIPIAPAEGDWAAWIGGYDNESAFIQQRVRVPEDRPILAFNLQTHSYDLCGLDPEVNNPYGLDFGGLIIYDIESQGLIYGTTLVELDTCDGNGSTTSIFDDCSTLFELCEAGTLGGWNSFAIDLSFVQIRGQTVPVSLVGKEIVVRFAAITDESNVSSVFVDEVRWQHSFTDVPQSRSSRPLMSMTFQTAAPQQVDDGCCNCFEFNDY